MRLTRVNARGGRLRRNRWERWVENLGCSVPSVAALFEKAMQWSGVFFIYFFIHRVRPVQIMAAELTKPYPVHRPRAARCGSPLPSAGLSREVENKRT